jgi:hypothetical protein
MRRTWNEIKNHRRASGLFLLYWLIVLGLHVFRWNAPLNTQDIVPPVLGLHLLLPLIAGATVCWWRRSKPRSIMDGMLAGAAALVIDTPLVVRDIGIVPFLIPIGIIGLLLGLIGASAGTALWRMLEDRQSPMAGQLNPLDVANQPGTGCGVAAENSTLGGAGGTVPRWMLLLAAGLAFGIAVIVALGVIPAVRTDTFAGARPGAAATAFAFTAILNVLVGIALLASVPWRSGGAGKVLIVVAGVVGLLLGSALLDAAGAFAGHGPGMRTAVVICFAGAAGDLGAGVLALIAAFRGRRKFREE